MQIIDTCKANEGVVSHSQCSTGCIHYKHCEGDHSWVLIPCSAGRAWRIYLFICCHQICIQLVNNTQWQLNGPVCTQNIEPTRALFGLDICSILSFPWTMNTEKPPERLSRGWLTADSSNYLLLISAKTEERRKFIINNPSREWHWAQITAAPASRLKSLKPHL